MHLFLYIITGILYITGFVFLFRWLNHRKERPVSGKWLTAAFAAKLAAGFAYGYVYAHYFPVSDSWVYFNESLAEYQNLLTHPSAFFSTGISFSNLTDFFSTADDAPWSNAGENLLIKLLAVFNVFSGGNYYIDIIFFNALSFWGLYLIYFVARKHIQRNGLLIFCTVFFLPSCLFWNSGIDKDGLIVFFTGVLFYAADYCITVKQTVRQLGFGVLSFAFIFLLRNVNALILLPALTAWWISIKLVSARPYLVYLIVYGACVIFFFLSPGFPSKFNLPLKLAEKQHQFLKLEANTVLPLTPLKPTVKSYAEVLPQAANHVFLRPYITEIKSPFHLMAFAEIILIVLIVIGAVISGAKHILPQLLQPFCLFLIMISLVGLLIIGYTVPFTGAIVRYKAWYIVLLLLPFVGSLNKNFLHSK
ncbi:hypothetical protein [Agriterribacter sp.]|uniref:hypothetical protein n=1 Tax=Agriterribacter sp. TaxID=2821509 RepID=UPI002BABF826|nr:hypothetical protein [Agriterribacter sp.]HRP57953.1 hypothetical protein [Agriterribacter sp.]